MIDKCYRCDEVISMCPCDESTYTADDEISRLRAELAEFKKSMRDAAQTARLLGLGFSSVDRRQALAAELYMRLNALAAKEE